MKQKYNRQLYRKEGTYLVKKREGITLGTRLALTEFLIWDRIVTMPSEVFNCSSTLHITRE